MRRIGPISIDRRFLYLGVFFVAMGGIMLLADDRVLDSELLVEAWRLWPVAVIAFGVGLVLRRTPIAVAGGVLLAAVPGIALGGLLAVGPQVGGCGAGQPGTFTTAAGTLADGASADISLGCGELSVNTAPGSGWRLESGNTNGDAAQVDSAADHLTIGAQNRTWFGFRGGRSVWQVTLPTAPKLDLSLEVGAGRADVALAGAHLGNVSVHSSAGDAHVDLTGASIDHLSLSANASAVSLRLPDSTDFSGTFSLNVGSLRLCAPADLGLRIHSSSSLGSAHYRGLTGSGDMWESPDYATAGHHAELTVNSNLGSVELNPQGGCQ